MKIRTEKELRTRGRVEAAENEQLIKDLGIKAAHESAKRDNAG